MRKLQKCKEEEIPFDTIPKKKQKKQSFILELICDSVTLCLEDIFENLLLSIQPMDVLVQRCDSAHVLFSQYQKILLLKSFHEVKNISVFLATVYVNRFASLSV